MDAPRRRVPRLAWIAAVAVVLLAAAAAFLLRSGDLRLIARDLVNGRLLRGSNLRLTWATVEGNALKRLQLTGVRLDIRSGRNWRPYLSADSVSLDAGIPQLLRATRIEVRLAHPVLHLSADSAGAILEPHLPPGKGGGGGLEVAKLLVTRGRVELDSGGTALPWVTWLDASARIELAHNPRIVVDRARAGLPGLGLTVSGLSVDVLSDSSGIRWHSLQARGPGFGVTGAGRFHSGRDFEITARLDSLRSGIIAPWAGGRLPQALYSGQAHVSTPGGRLRLQSSGHLATASLGEGDGAVDLVADSSFVELRQLDLESPMGKIRAHGSLRPSGRATLEWALANGDPSNARFLPAQARLRDTRINAAGTLELAWKGRRFLSAGGGILFAPSLFAGESIQRAEGQYQYSDSILSLTDFSIIGADAQVSGGARLGPGSAIAGSGLLASDLSALRRFMGSDRGRLEGKVQGQWRLAGSRDRPVADGSLRAVGVQWNAVSAESTAVQVSWQGPEIEGLTADAVVRGIRVGNVAVHEAKLTTVGGPAMRFEVHVASGDSTLALAGHVQWKQNTAVVDSGSLVLALKRWDQDHPARVAWSGDLVTWDDVRWLSPDGDSIATSGRYRPREEALTASFEAHRWALGPLTAHFLGPHAPQGQLSGSVRVQGTLRDPQADIAASVDRAVIEGHRMDHAALEGSLRGGTLSLAHLELTRGDATVSGSGKIDLPELRAHGLHVFDGSDSAWAHGATFDGEAQFGKLDLPSLSEFYAPLGDAAGEVGGWIRVGGTASRPQLELRLSGEGLAYRDLQLGKAELRLHYADELLHVDTLSGGTPATRIQAAGEVPVAWTLDPPRLSLLDRPMHLESEETDVDAAVLSLWLPDLIAYASGKVSLKLSLSGTPPHPRYLGQGSLKGVTLRPAGREEVLRDLQAEIELSDETLQLKSLHASTGRNGELSGTGHAHFVGRRVDDYHFDLTATELTLTDQENYSAVAGGTLTIAPRGGGIPDPVIRGNLQVRQGVILTEFGIIPPAFQATSEKPLFRWYYDLNVAAPSDIWWRNSQANIEVGGELRVLNLNGSNEAQGSLDIRRGTFDVYDTSFRISDGTVAFNGPVENPSVTLNADASVSGYKVSLNLPGIKVSELKNPSSIVLTSDPSMSQAEIIRYMTVGRFMGGGVGIVPPDTAHAVPGSPAATAQGGNLYSGVTNLLLRQALMRGVFSNFSGFVDAVDLSTNTNGSGVQVSQIAVGKYVTPDLFVRYAQGLGATADIDLSVEWRLNKIFLIRGQTIQRLTNSASTTTQNESNVDLKARLDF